MVYIAIPKGWTFIKADVANSKDRLVDESGKQIVIQELVKDALQHVVRGTSSINGNTKNTHGLKVTIYFRRPPDTLEEFLMYKPTKNGKLPAEHTEMVVGRDKQIKHVSTSHTVMLWHTQAVLSTARHAELADKSARQKADRRHIGDSPKAT